MATQLRPTDYQPIPAPRARPSVRVAFSTSAAAQAIARSTDALLPEVGEKTLDELATEGPSAIAGRDSHVRGVESATDEALIAELREKGLEGPITADFLASFRQEREFMRLASALDAIPDGVEKLKRALVRAGVLPPEDGMNDKQLLGAWDRWMANVQALHASGPDATEEDDAPAYTAMDIADDVVLDLPAVTPVGALVKLRRALHMAATKSWVEKALVEQNDTELFARAEELDVPCRLIIDAIAAIVRTNSDGEPVA